MNAEERSALRRIDRQFEAVRAMPPPIPPAERYRHSIEEVGQGSYLRVGGQPCRVEAVHHYVEVNKRGEEKWRWYELELLGLESGETTYIEWEKDDEVEVSINCAALSLREIGRSADEIEAMSDRENGTISHAGRSYHYDDDYKARFHRDGGEAGEPVWFCDFETSDERWCLSVEEWGSAEEGYEYEVYVSEYVAADAVEVLVLSPRSVS